MQFDARGFISPPFTRCPKCNNEDCFGVLLIGGNMLTRRCRQCWFSSRSPLPDLQKKVLYLDQFVISEMMKAVNDSLGKKNRIDPFFFTVFEKLEWLMRAQVLVCPQSALHFEESALYEYRAHKRMYEHFSCGVSFYDSSTIKRFQIEQRFRAYLKNEKCCFNMDASSVLQGRVNVWTDRFRVSLNWEPSDEDVQGLRNRRSRVHEGLAEVYGRWKGEKSKCVEDWFREEMGAYGPGLLESYFASIAKLAANQIRHGASSAEEMLGVAIGSEHVLFSSLLSLTEQEDIDDQMQKIVAFLKSEALFDLPFLRLRALFLGHIAHAAAHGGQIEPPNRGMANDIEMVSTLLPYCDAIFVDRAVFNILSGSAFRRETARYETKIFSRTNGDDFLKYLDSLINEVRPDQLECLEQVYGKDWSKPFWEMYGGQ